MILNKSYDTFRQGESISISDISTWVKTKRQHSIDQLQTDNQLIDSQTSSIYMEYLTTDIAKAFARYHYI